MEKLLVDTNIVVEPFLWHDQKDLFNIFFQKNQC
jgi:hypothetical protein